MSTDLVGRRYRETQISCVMQPDASEIDLLELANHLSLLDIQPDSSDGRPKFNRRKAVIALRPEG